MSKRRQRKIRHLTGGIAGSDDASDYMRIRAERREQSGWRKAFFGPDFPDNRPPREAP